MLSQSHLDRIDRRCANVLMRAVDSFPGFLEQSEPEAAAAIVADLIKSQLTRPPAESDPAAALTEVIRAVHKEEQADSPEQQSVLNPVHPE